MPVSSLFPNADKVLLVDVDEADALDLSSFLELNGYTVRRSAALDEAVTEFTTFAPGIVIIDANLPAKSWLLLTQKIRQHEIAKDRDYRCIIIITAMRYTTEIHQSAAKAGAHEVIGKPVDQRLLIEKLRAHTTIY